MLHICTYTLLIKIHIIEIKLRYVSKIKLYHHTAVMDIQQDVIPF